MGKGRRLGPVSFGCAHSRLTKLRSLYRHRHKDRTLNQEVSRAEEAHIGMATSVFDCHTRDHPGKDSTVNA